LGRRVNFVGLRSLEGDCNSGHTQDGAMDAPGRIVVP
jgi:hypothetical protein